jgi:phosphonate transport system substrate-binding protein
VNVVKSAHRQRRSTTPRAFRSLVLLVAFALAAVLTAQPALAAMSAPTVNGVAQQAALGTPDNPIKMAFVPSQDSQKVLASGQPLADLLSQETGLSFTVSVPTSYAAVVEGMGSENVDVGWLASFVYVLAHDKFKSTVILSTVRGGSKTYTGQIISHVDSGVNTLADLPGKKFAFVDPGSASGNIYPRALLLQNGIDPATAFAESIFAGGHDKVVIAVYNRQVDAGATFGDSVEGITTDARTNVVSTLPDVMEKVQVIGKTAPIPNDTVSVRAGLPAELALQIQEGLLSIAKTDQGKALLKSLYNIDGLALAMDADYDPVRAAASALGMNLENELAPR